MYSRHKRKHLYDIYIFFSARPCSFPPGPPLSHLGYLVYFFSFSIYGFDLYSIVALKETPLISRPSLIILLLKRPSKIQKTQIHRNF
ncbi:hypothetical protein K450DRAFT_255709 [Umbelopsis ramanniana AG]|uniref:Uncharacterized protein n=1 Tax=Umbelopsis ramanniana AG TaxID=1314678 RepID=A0AAD5E4H9_UMBRA|nr:uncharacterized protein K450DRAFT_255709 [Umbelopsis ramanniana AG]KAI8576697.1 hypothetical protein K450DRAFT_255709 [Umbelopsis ramanniana AG]